MSEEKFYVVKNDAGEYWFTVSEENAKNEAKNHDGHVVTLVEESKKVVLTKEQAEIVKGAHEVPWPAKWIDDKAGGSNQEELLMNAYVNGYTVAKEKKYNVKVPYTNYKWYLKTPDGTLDTIWVKGLSKGFGGYPDGIELTNDDIEKFGLQDCEKEEVTDDDQ